MPEPAIGGQNSNDDGQNNPQVTFTIRDFGGETSQASGYINQPDVVDASALLTAVGTFREAMQSTILGVTAREKGDFFNTKLDGRSASDENAQRERKWKIFAVDTTEFLDQVNAVRNPNFQETTTMEIPTARVVDTDGNSMLLAGTELADPNNPYIQSLVTAYEGLFKSDAVGDLEVQRIELVGRNL